MFTQLKKSASSILVLCILFLFSCEKTAIETPDESEANLENRWITVAGALMGTTPGDGNGGTMVYAVRRSEAKDPTFSINVYDAGFPVKSNRTARLQSSEDGSLLFNIAYTGDNGGEFARYKVNGANSFVQEDVTVNIAQYASTSPRWSKLQNGDKTGIAVNVASIAANNTGQPGVPFQYYRGTATVLSLDLKNVLIEGYKQYQIPLTAEEEAQGHCIFRLDAPVLNKAQNKLIIGTWMRKYNPSTGQVESSFKRLGSKSVVVDFPSLTNPRVITSSVSQGDNSGYRSPNAFVAEDGSIYQATQRDTRGSHILRINTQEEYDNQYVFSLDAALGVKGAYVDSWKYVGNGIAYALYTYEGTTQGFVARLNLSNKTATRVDGISYDADLNFGQYQGILVLGEEVYLAVTPTGKDGRIYVIDAKTGDVSLGAKLINKAGNHYIGIF